jgi:hypothetical protein
MSLVSVISNVSLALGQGAVSVVIAATDETTLELLVLANNSGKSLARSSDFPELQKIVSFSATGQVDQGQFLGSAGVVTDGDYLRMVPDTFWNSTARRPIIFPSTPSEWSVSLAFGTIPVNLLGIILDRNLQVGPVNGPSSGDSLTFMYYGGFWCASAAGTGQAAWAADTDVGIIPENLLELDLIWRWKQMKFLPYSEDLETAEREILSHTGAAGGRRLLILGGRSGYGYVSNIPEGNWG